MLYAEERDIGDVATSAAQVRRAIGRCKRCKQAHGQILLGKPSIQNHSTTLFISFGNLLRNDVVLCLENVQWNHHTNTIYAEMWYA